ncbi:MAG: hypothetical protein KBF83_05775 [Pyrinomonadaceae bacterium]|nr:hypothetical protein [Pyrinomonadaceae bacterium]MBP9109043.1 hypothetical protein [Pyrinomonadaceae bacterium]
MAVNFAQNPTGLAPNKMVLTAVALMTVALVVGFFLVGVLSDAFDSFPYLFLLPWVIALAAVFATPSIFLYYRGEFSLANPIVFATISYFVPAFVFGGIFLSTGYSEPYFLSYIQDADYNLPLTIVLIGLGFISLSIGYFVPIGNKVGELVGRYLPSADYSSDAFLFPGIILLILGVMNTIFAFGVGLFGYQVSEETNIYAGLIYLSTLLRVQGTFLLWVVVFKQKKFTAITGIVVALLIAVDLSSAIFAGNRGTILQVFFVVVLAFVFAGRKIRMKYAVVASVLLSLGIIAGMIYGTTFRIVKGTESQQSSGQYADNIAKTIDEVSRRSAFDSVSMGLAMLSERLDIVSTLAVVVSNYEQLKPYEEAYGLDNNIWTDTTTFFIPRVIWVEKPAASDARKYSDLYFNVSDSSFAITPMGDLLRNYGIIGIPIGMFILGVILRLIYSSLVTPSETPIWKAMLYFMLLTTVSYEGFYGTIVPTMFKVAFTALIGVLIVVFIARKLDRRGAQITV